MSLYSVYYIEQKKLVEYVFLVKEIYVGINHIAISKFICHRNSQMKKKEAENLQFDRQTYWMCRYNQTANIEKKNPANYYSERISNKILIYYEQVARHGE